MKSVEVGILKGYRLARTHDRVCPVMRTSDDWKDEVLSG